MKKSLLMLGLLISGCVTYSQSDYAGSTGTIQTTLPPCDAAHVGSRNGDSVCREYTGNDKVMEGTYYWRWEPK